MKRLSSNRLTIVLVGIAATAVLLRSPLPAQEASKFVLPPAVKSTAPKAKIPLVDSSRRSPQLIGAAGRARILPATPHPLNVQPNKQQTARPVKPYFVGGEKDQHLLGGAGTKDELETGIDIRVGYGAASKIRHENDADRRESGWVFDKSTLEENRSTDDPPRKEPTAPVSDSEEDLGVGPKGMARTIGGGALPFGSDVAPDTPEIERQKVLAETQRMDEIVRKEMQAADDAPPPPPRGGVKDYYLVDDQSTVEWLAPTGYKKVWVQWECDQPQRLTGRFTMRGSGISNLKRLGTTGDEVATIHGSSSSIDIYPTTPRDNGGFVFESKITRASVLLMELQGELGANLSTKTHAIPLASLNRTAAVFELPGGIRVTVRKQPSPTKLVYQRSSMIFEPGEKFNFEILLDEIPSVANTMVRCTASLVAARTGEVINTFEQDAITDVLGQFQGLRPFDIPMPRREGAYDVEIELSTNRKTGVFAKSQVISRRSIQLLVVDPKLQSLQPANSDEGRWDLLQEVELHKVTKVNLHAEDPHAPFASTKLIDDATTRSLRIVGTIPGQPHIAELVCLASEPGRYSIAVQRVGNNVRDTIVESEFQIDSNSEKVSTHQLMFWPSEEEVTIVVKHSDSQAETNSTQLRIYAGPANLPRTAAPSSIGRRLSVAYLESPLMGIRYGSQPVRVRSGHKIGDWQYYLESTVRHAQFLNNSGYGAAMITVAGSGGSIYPSAHISPSPVFDKAEYFPNGAGMPRKDILELMFRVFDREQMTLIPTIRFDFPIQSLERRIASGDTDLRMLNEHGETWWNANPEWGARGPYYNPLNPTVRMAIQRIVDEVITRYNGHTSFGGVALVIDENTYLQFPGHQWGSDRQTRESFQQFVKRTSGDRIRSEMVLDAWTGWRKDQLKSMLVDLSSNLFEDESSRKLYIVDKVPMPSPSQVDLRNELQEETGKSNTDIVWVADSLAQGAVASSRRSGNRRVTENDAATALLRLEKRKAVLIPETPNIQRTGATTRIPLVTRIAAVDPDIVVHQLGSLTSGHVSALRNAFTSIQSIPEGTFREVASTKTEDRTIIVRTASSSAATYGYVTNNSGWPAKVALTFNELGELQVQSNSQSRIDTNHDDQTWTARIEPFDVVSFRIAKPGVRIVNWRTVRDAGDSAEMLAWCDQVNAHIDAAKRLRLNTYSSLVNPDFQKHDTDGKVLGWDVARGAGLLLGTQPDDSQSNLAMSIRTEMPLGWPNAPIGWIRSNAFPTPESGRLLIKARVRSANDFATTRVRMVVFGDVGGKQFQKAIWIEPNAPNFDREGHAITDGSPYRAATIELVDFQHSPANQLQVIFEVHGGGQVWIDKVDVFDKFFTGREIAALESLHNRAVEGIQRDDFSRCLAMQKAPIIDRLLHQTPVILPEPTESVEPQPLVDQELITDLERQPKRIPTRKVAVPSAGRDIVGDEPKSKPSLHESATSSRRRYSAGRTIDKSASPNRGVRRKPAEIELGLIGSETRAAPTRIVNGPVPQVPLSKKPAAKPLTQPTPSGQLLASEDTDSKNSDEAKPSVTDRFVGWLRIKPRKSKEQLEAEQKSPPRMSMFEMWKNRRK